jgi:hypothetical protein
VLLLFFKNQPSVAGKKWAGKPQKETDFQGNFHRDFTCLSQQLLKDGKSCSFDLLTR